MQVDDNVRERINSARRQNYSDDVIASVLAETMPQVQMALDERISPSIILDELASPPTTGEQIQRGVGIAARGVTEALAPVAAGALAGGLVGGPPGAALGAVAMPIAQLGGDIIASGANRLLGTNIEPPSQTISRMIPGPRAETPTERVVEAASGALGGTAAGIGAARQLARMPTVSPTGPSAEGLQRVGQELSRAPVGQVTTAPVAAGVGQQVTEDTDNPFLGFAASMAAASAMGLRRGKFESVNPDEMLAKTKANYKILDDAQFAINSREFDRKVTEIQIKLMDEGYVPNMPLSTGQIDELFNVLRHNQKTHRPITEIVNMRKTIGNTIASTKDNNVRRLAREMLDEYDNFLMNVTDRQLAGVKKNATEFKTVMDAWKTAREDFRKLKKAELIQDMVDRADLAPSGKEISLTQSLKNLANNKEKMRFFSPDEQKAIRDTAKGGELVQALRLVGKFAPLTPAAAIFTAVSPFGAFTAGAGVAGKTLAAERRLQQVSKLQDQMLLGRKPQQLQGPFRNLPVYTGRAALNMLGPEFIEGDARNALGR
jgi:hypothetical protein